MLPLVFIVERGTGMRLRFGITVQRCVFKPASPVPLTSARALGKMHSKSLSTLLKVCCSNGRTHSDNGLAGEDMAR